MVWTATITNAEVSVPNLIIRARLTESDTGVILDRVYPFDAASLGGKTVLQVKTIVLAAISADAVPIKTAYAIRDLVNKNLDNLKDLALA